VDDAAECRHAVDADILEFVTVAVVRRLMRHARIERIAQCRISNELTVQNVYKRVENFLMLPVWQCCLVECCQCCQF
jgi:hypothetical protein